MKIIETPLPPGRTYLEPAAKAVPWLIRSLLQSRNVSPEVAADYGRFERLGISQIDDLETQLLQRLTLPSLTGEVIDFCNSLRDAKRRRAA